MIAAYCEVHVQPMVDRDVGRSFLITDFWDVAWLPHGEKGGVCWHHPHYAYLVESIQAFSEHAFTRQP